MTDSLDPTDWTAARAQGHRMLDDLFDHLRTLRDQPVWRPIPAAVRSRFERPLPQGPSPLAEVHQDFLDDVLPYAGGNLHPGFMGWVQGAGTPVGMLAEMLAGGLNANLGGRDHAPIAVGARDRRLDARSDRLSPRPPAVSSSPAPPWPISSA